MRAGTSGGSAGSPARGKANSLCRGGDGSVVSSVSRTNLGGGYCAAALSVSFALTSGPEANHHFWYALVHSMSAAPDRKLERGAGD